MTQTDQKRWEAVLQGHAPATDRDTLEAQAIREYYDATLSPLLAPRDDLARERRLRNLVESRLATLASHDKPHQPTTPRANPIKAWLDSAHIGWPALGAATAAVVLGVLVGPMWQSQTAPEDDWAVPKSTGTGLPVDPSVPKRLDPSAPAADSSQTLAKQVQAELVRLGIESNVVQAQDGWRVTADIRPAQRDAATNALKPFGITVPDDGRLRVLVR